MLPSPAKFLQKTLILGAFSTLAPSLLKILFYFETRNQAGTTPKQWLRKFFCMSLASFVAHRSSNDKSSGVTSRPIFQWCSNSKLYFC